MKKIHVVLLSAMLSMSAVAQEKKAAAPVAPAPTAPAPSTLPPPKHQCKGPEALGKLASNTQQKQFVKEIDAYRNCLMAYRDDMNKLAKATVDQANAAVEEFNAYVAELNKK